MVVNYDILDLIRSLYSNKKNFQHQEIKFLLKTLSYYKLEKLTKVNRAPFIIIPDK